MDLSYEAFLKRQKLALSGIVSFEPGRPSVESGRIKEALFKHFRPCGPILKIYFPETDPPNSRATIIMIGEADKDAKALELDGSEAVGGKLVVQAKPAPQPKYNKDAPFN